MSNNNPAVATKLVESPEVTRLKAEMAALQAESAKLKAQLDASAKSHLIKVSEKGAVSVYGLNSQFPTTLYSEQWTQLLGSDPAVLPPLGKAIVEFINSKPAGLVTKAMSNERKAAAKAKAEADERAARIAAAGMTGRTA